MFEKVLVVNRKSNKTPMNKNSANKIFNKNCKNLILYFLIICSQQIQAQGVKLVPLTAPKVYQLLRQNNYLEALPEGRIVTQGIAAVTGFTLGLKTALGGVFIYDVITANITEDTTTTPAPSNATARTYLTQELCFNSRMARSLDEAEAIAEAYSRLEEKDTTLRATVRRSPQRRRFKPKRNRKRKIEKNRIYNGPKRIKVLRSNVGNTEQTLTTNPTTSGSAKADPSMKTAADEEPKTDGSEAIQPQAINVATGTNGATNINAGNGLGTTLSTTTSTDNDNPVTCIVLQKPKNSEQ